MERGEWSVDASPLRARPAHRGRRPPTPGTAYSRDVAAFPAGRAGAGDKYWPPVGRIDGAYGDRNLMCSCPPLSEYEHD